ncbi:peptidase [Methylobacterium sp. Leaf399]|uniref:EcsC family protein n=1 Tax=Methylobacterium sp. Leaf466 TaxID=1736386 RepID=UPI0006FCC36E|nr:MULTISPECIES: EcsC family protein [unclassified Methylobacterium]KQT09816.1 peptidase [Methylobacterium sp. Leaf399]KQT77948.1 peptidase [Methylobacterium sp. Leaf466]
MADVSIALITDDSVTLPAAPAGAPGLSADDREALRRAVLALEKPGLAARLSAAVGAPLDMIGRALPAPVTDVVARSTDAAMRTALRIALASLPAAKPATGRDLIDALDTPAPKRFANLFGSSETKHKVFAGLSGAVGGAFGLATLAVELPLSTTLMLRSIAEIARSEGEDLAKPENALACMQVFALGGRAGAETSLSDSGYFAVRAALAKTMAEAARYAGNKALLDEAAPALIRFSAQIASRFGLVVSQKVAAQAVPIVGAVGGAAVNVAFMDHFQATARAHFTVRRLERVYGQPAVRAAYELERAALGA